MYIYIYTHIYTYTHTSFYIPTNPAVHQLILACLTGIRLREERQLTELLAVTKIQSLMRLAGKKHVLYETIKTW